MAEYLRYVVNNIDPVRVADDAVSQNGQTDTLSFIPGSAVRGLVISAFAKEEDFNDKADLKKTLFSDSTVFTNAYLTTKDHTLIPSPKGFYEDKTSAEGVKKLSANVAVDGKNEPGTKRASLGRYCYIENGCINYYSVKTGLDLKIRINNGQGGKSEMFRCEYIAPGQCFEGYIRLTGTDADSTIKQIFYKDSIVMLGNSRSSGLGKCRVVLSEIINGIPYQAECFDVANECYVELLSDTVLRDSTGELCGFNKTVCDGLGKDLGVDNLEIKFCSTSTRTINGYNRTWQSKTPSMTAYEQGSVFHLSYSGTISSAAMEKLADEGIGIRRNEGFGRILFLKNYENVDSKISREYACDEKESTEISSINLTDDDRETLKVVAKGYYKGMINRRIEEYIVKTPIKKAGLTNSQLGTVDSILSAVRYDPEAAKARISEYFDRVIDKESKQKAQKSRASVKAFKNQVINEILGRSIADILFEEERPEKIMNIPITDIIGEEEEESLKIRLLIRMIRYSYKEV